MANWRALLTSDVARDGRQLLREILEAPLRFTPDGRAYRFIAPVATGRVVAELAGVSTWVASPGGESLGGQPVATNVASPRGESAGCTGEQLGWRPWRHSCPLASRVSAMRRAWKPPADDKDGAQRGSLASLAGLADTYLDVPLAGTTRRAA